MASPLPPRSWSASNSTRTNTSPTLWWPQSAASFLPFTKPQPAAAAASPPFSPALLPLTVDRRCCSSSLLRRGAGSGGCRSLGPSRRRVTAGSDELDEGPSPSPPEPPPPFGNGWEARLSELQDRVRIFFAVLFWVSLFFWGSAWDGRNNSGGKKRQRSRNKPK